jgi:hypothetical protein
MREQDGVLFLHQLPDSGYERNAFVLLELFLDHGRYIPDWAGGDDAWCGGHDMKD